MLRLMLLVLLMQPRPTPWPSGTLTLRVRLANGTPVAGLRADLWQDTDTDGLVLRRTATTNADGVIILADLPWAIYRVQLAGQLPDGRTVTMAALPTDDGMPLDGFGIRFAMAAHTELYVLTPTPDGQLAATFDMAPDATAPPVPFHSALAADPATPLTPAPLASTGAVPAGQAGRWDRGCLAVVSLASLAVAGLLGRGWWLGRRQQRGGNDV